MPVKIYKPARNAMQSGKGKAQSWVLEHEAEAPRSRDPLMGWTSSGDTRQQLKLFFDTREEAMAYADARGPRLSGDAGKPGAHSQEILFRQFQIRPHRQLDTLSVCWAFHLSAVTPAKVAVRFMRHFQFSVATEQQQHNFSLSVIPAKAGTQAFNQRSLAVLALKVWVPAFAGMTT